MALQKFYTAKVDKAKLWGESFSMKIPTETLRAFFSGLLLVIGLAPCAAGPGPLPQEAFIDTVKQIFVGQITRIKDAPEVRTSQGVRMGRATASIQETLKGSPSKTVQFLIVSQVGPDYGGAPDMRSHKVGESGVWFLSEDAEGLRAEGLMPAERKQEVQRTLNMLANRKWSPPINGLRAWAAAVLPDHHNNPVIIFAVNNVTPSPIYVPFHATRGLITVAAVDKAGKTREYVLGNTGTGNTTVFCQKLAPGKTVYLHPDASFIDLAWKQGLPPGEYTVVVKCQNAKEGETTGRPGEKVHVEAWKGHLQAPAVQLLLPEPDPARTARGVAGPQ